MRVATPDQFPDRHQDPQVTEILLTTLGEAAALRERYVDVVFHEPAEGSHAEEDRALPLGANPFQLGMVAWIVGADNGLSWFDLLQAGVQPMSAHYNLARASIEGAVTCQWLLDPDVGSEERRRRGAIAQLNDYRNRRAFEQSAGGYAAPPVPPAQSGAQLYDAHAAQMTALGMPFSAMPEMGKLFGRYSAGEWLYRLLSAHAHGKQWGLFTQTKAALIPGILPDTFRAKFTADDSFTIVAARLAVHCLTSALAEAASYLGQPTRNGK